MKVFLPRAEVVLHDCEQGTDIEQVSRTKAGKSILVVDDDATVLRTTLRMLDALGYEAVPGANGRDALRLIADGQKVDVVLADFAMPEMTGVELTKTIHATRPALPVILVTRYDNRELLRDFGEAQILQKPYTEEELVEMTTRALS